jgi:hypothetical protein
MSRLKHRSLTRSASPEENESASSFPINTLCGMLDVGQAFVDASSWRVFFAGSERGRGTRPRALAEQQLSR